MLIDLLSDLQPLIDPATGQYYTEEVSVTRFVNLSHERLLKLPVKFGTVGGNFYCSNNQLTSLEGIHKVIKNMNGAFWCNGNPIKAGGIGLILIDGLTKIVADQPAFEIINRYLGQGSKGLLRCQDELIDAGFEEFARL